MNKCQPPEGQWGHYDNLDGCNDSGCIGMAQTSRLGSWALLRAHLFPRPSLPERREGKAGVPLVLSLSFWTILLVEFSTAKYFSFWTYWKSTLGKVGARARGHVRKETLNSRQKTKCRELRERVLFLPKGSPFCKRSFSKPVLGRCGSYWVGAFFFRWWKYSRMDCGGGCTYPWLYQKPVHCKKKQNTHTNRLCAMWCPGLGPGTEKLVKSERSLEFSYGAIPVLASPLRQANPTNTRG